MSRDRKPDRDRIAAEVALFLAKGGAIERLPTSGPGACSGKEPRLFNCGADIEPVVVPRAFLPMKWSE